MDAKDQRLPGGKIGLRAREGRLSSTCDTANNLRPRTACCRPSPGPGKIRVALFGRDEPIVTTATLAAGPNTVVIRVP